jgi:hypothetical protein
MGSRDCEDTFFRKILEEFGGWLDWVSEIFSNLGRTRTFYVGLRRLLDCMGLVRVADLTITQQAWNLILRV